jgi:hypothetical protein
VGQVVTVDLIAQPSKHAQPVGRVAEVSATMPMPAWKSNCSAQFNLPHASKKARAVADEYADSLSERTSGQEGPPGAALRHHRRRRRDFGDAVMYRREM